MVQLAWKWILLIFLDSLHTRFVGGALVLAENDSFEGPLAPTLAEQRRARAAVLGDLYQRSEAVPALTMAQEARIWILLIILASIHTGFASGALVLAENDSFEGPLANPGRAAACQGSGFSRFISTF